jgi:hypothetical protein
MRNRGAVLLALGLAALLAVLYWPQGAARPTPAGDVGGGAGATRSSSDPHLSRAPTSWDQPARGSDPSEPSGRASPAGSEAGEEPGYADITKLGGHVEGRAAEVLVLRGTRPEGGARVRVFGPGEVLVGEALTDVEGRVRVEVPTAGGHRLEIRTDDLPPFSTDVIIGEAASSRPVVVLGSGSIVGRAYDDEGRPRAGQSLWILAVAPDAVGAQTDQQQVTDEKGDFRFVGLHSGTWLLKTSLRTWTPEVGPVQGGPWHQMQIPLRRGESRRVDVGAPEATALWEGSVRYADGTPVETASAIVVHRTQGDVHIASAFGLASMGRIRVRLAPGPWRAMVWLPQGRRSLAEGVHPDRGGGEDIVLSGTRVVGRVRNAPEGEQITWRTEGSETPSGRVHVRPDGGFVLDGLSPGRWILSGSPADVTTGRGEAPVIEVPEGGAHQSVDLDAAVR